MSADTPDSAEYENITHAAVRYTAILPARIVIATAIGNAKLHHRPVARRVILPKGGAELAPVDPVRKLPADSA